MRYLLAILVMFLFAPPSAHALWLDSSWDYRVKVEVAPTKVGTSTAVTDFPVFNDCGGFPTTFWTNASSTGADLRVVESDEITETAFELVKFSTTSKRCELHFKADSLSTTSSSTFYVYYGNPAASAYASSSTYGRNNVWTNYVAVWHLDGLTDSKATYDLTNYNSTAFSTGRMGDAADIGTGNTNKNVRVSSNLGMTGGPITMRVWLKLAAEITTGNNGIAMKGSQTNFINDLITYNYNGGTRRLEWNRQRQNQSNNTITHNVTLGTTDWHQITYTYDGTNLRGYLNGVLVAGPLTTSGNGVGGTNLNSTSLFSNFNTDGNGQYGGIFPNGLMDDAFVASSTFSAAHILTEYNNQSSTSTFFYIGPEETDAPPAEPEATTTPMSVYGAGVFGGATILR